MDKARITSEYLKIKIYLAKTNERGEEWGEIIYRHLCHHQNVYIYSLVCIFTLVLWSNLVSNNQLPWSSRYKPQIKNKNSSESSFFCPDSFTDNFILEIKYLNKNVFGRNTNYFWLILTTSVQSVWVRHWEMEYFFCFLKQITVFIQNSFKSQIDGYCSKCVAWLTFVYIPIINIPPNASWMVNRNSEIIF